MDEGDETRMTLWTVGYNAWPVAVRAERLVGALKQCGVTRLADVRLNPSASDVKPGRYGPKPWTLQVGRSGVAGLLAPAGIAYEWLVELGNPQRHDPMTAVLRAHLADPEGGWPVHRGLAHLSRLVHRPGEAVALLCACAEYRTCHRTLVARALAAQVFNTRLIIRDVRSRDVIDPVTAG
jgi:hypothetical protein